MRRVLVLVIDVGGSSLKANVMEASGQTDFLLTDDLSFDIDTSQDRHSILASFRKLFDYLIMEASQHCQDGFDIVGIALAFPGPADYEAGIPLMLGLAKYESLYGIALFDDLKEELNRAAKRIQGLNPGAVNVSDDLRITMQNDARMYAYGAWIANGRPQNLRIASLTLGTGLGSAFIVNGELMTDRPERNQQEGLPGDAYIYHLPLEGKTADDMLSTRGLVELALEHGIHIQDGLELSRLVDAGQKDALAVFKAFGKRLSTFIDAQDGLLPFGADVVYLGGNLMKAFDYMEIKTKTAIAVVMDSRHPLRGAGAYWLDKIQETIKES